MARSSSSTPGGNWSRGQVDGGKVSVGDLDLLWVVALVQAGVDLARDQFHPEWNYSISPSP